MAVINGWDRPRAGCSCIFLCTLCLLLLTWSITGVACYVCQQHASTGSILLHTFRADALPQERNPDFVSFPGFSRAEDDAWCSHTISWKKTNPIAATERLALFASSGLMYRYKPSTCMNVGHFLIFFFMFRKVVYSLDVTLDKKPSWNGSRTVCQLKLHISRTWIQAAAWTWEKGMLLVLEKGGLMLPR